MIRRILVLGGISVSIAFAQGGGGRGRGGTPQPPPEPGTAKERKLWAYDVTIPPNYTPPKTPWGEPDLQGIWPINHLIAVPLVRQARYGDRLYLTDKEFSALTARARGTGPVPDRDYPDRLMHQLSLIVDPPDGQFPALTDYGKQLQANMKSTYRPGQTVFDSVDDFASWDHCITRGMPVSMEDRNYNNGIRIMQSPGYVTILLEMAHEARVIPTNGMPPLPSEIKEWMGESRGHWEGNTLVVETTNFNGLTGQTSAGVPGSPGPLQPETTNFKTTEWFTRVAPDTIEYKMTISDPTVMVSSYTIAYPMFLDNKYQSFEYSCHEGNIQMRDYIETSRYERAHPKDKKQ